MHAGRAPPPPAPQGMGVLDKLVLVWDAPWWPPRRDFIAREMTDRSGRW